MVKQMQKENNYFHGFNGEKKDYLKYGLINDWGYNFESSPQNYNENAIIKTTHCNLKEKFKSN